MDECKLDNCVSVGSTFATYKTCLLNAKPGLLSKIFVSLDEQFVVIYYPDNN